MKDAKWKHWLLTLCLQPQCDVSCERGKVAAAVPVTQAFAGAVRRMLRRQVADLRALPASVAARRAAEAASLRCVWGDAAAGVQPGAPGGVHAAWAAQAGGANPTAASSDGDTGVCGHAGQEEGAVPAGTEDLTVLEVAVHTRRLRAQVAALAEACGCEPAGAEEEPGQASAGKPPGFWPRVFNWHAVKLGMRAHGASYLELAPLRLPCTAVEYAVSARRAHEAATCHVHG